LHSAYWAYVCVSCGAKNKQLLFPQTALIDRPLQWKRNVLCEVGTESLRIKWWMIFVAVPRLGRLDTSLSPPRAGFCLKSVWDLWWTEWYWDMFLFRLLWFSLVAVITPKLNTHLHLHVALIRKTNELSLGKFQKTAVLFPEVGSIE